MTLYQTLMSILMTVMAASMVMIMWRLIRGPSIPDRAMAFDLIMIHVAGLIALFAVVVDQKALLDTIIIVAVLGFLGTVAVARYIEEGRS